MDEHGPFSSMLCLKKMVMSIKAIKAGESERKLRKAPRNGKDNWLMLVNDQIILKNSWTVELISSCDAFSGNFVNHPEEVHMRMLVLHGVTIIVDVPHG